MDGVDDVVSKGLVVDDRAVVVTGAVKIILTVQSLKCNVPLIVLSAWTVMLKWVPWAK